MFVNMFVNMFVDMFAKVFVIDWIKWYWRVTPNNVYIYIKNISNKLAPATGYWLLYAMPPLPPTNAVTFAHFQKRRLSCKRGGLSWLISIVWMKVSIGIKLNEIAWWASLFRRSVAKLSTRIAKKRPYVKVCPNTPWYYSTSLSSLRLSSSVSS